MASDEKEIEKLQKENSETSLSQTSENLKMSNYICKTNKWRVKLYNLSESGQWEDFGIGYVFCAFEQKDLENQKKNEDKIQKLIMLNEDTCEEMFKIELKKNSVEFHNQRGIIITWKDGNNINEDNIAISFQEKEGVIEIWNNILINQGKNPLDKKNCILNDIQSETDLEVSIQNLPNLLRELGNDMDELKINNFVSFLKNSNYEFILKLGDLLKEEEKKLEGIKSSVSTETNYTILPSTINENNKNNEELHKENKNGKNVVEIKQKSFIEKQQYMENINYIFNIFKYLIFLGNKDLIETLLNDKCYLVTFGALEYDFEVFKIVPHRKYFKEVVKFKNPLNIEDEDILQKINMNIRLSYLRDTVLARIIDSNTLKTINFIIQINNNDIIQFFIDEDKYLTLLCEQLQDKNILIKRDAFLLFSELINCTKDIYQAKISFNEKLFELGIFKTLTENLKEITNENYINSINMDNLNKSQILLIREKIINIIIEIILNLLSVLPNEFTFLLKSNSLLNQLANLMLNNDNFGIKYEISNIFKMLIEINYRDESFINADIYNECFTLFLQYLKKPLEHNKKAEISTTKQIIIEIFIYLFYNNFDSKFWLKQNELDKIIINLIEENNKIVSLYVIKLLKCLVDYADYTICKQIFSKDLCDRLIHLFIDNIKNENIIISCLFDFFEIVNQKNDEIFNLIIGEEKDFFKQSEYKIFFKNINIRMENKPKEEKHLINYIKIDNYKELLPKILSNIKEPNENEINNNENDQIIFNSIGLNLNEEEKIKLLEKKRKRYFGESEYNEIGYYNDEYLNEYEYKESDNPQRRNKKDYSIFDEEEEGFGHLYEGILDKENKVNNVKEKDYKVKKSNKKK